MTDRSILHRYVRPDSGETDPRSPNADAVDDLGAFGWVRGIRDSARMLELRKKDGNIMAVGYAWLERAEFDPSVGITLSIGSQKIRITGRSLNTELRPGVRLFEGITRHRVSYVQEADRGSRMERSDVDTVIENISW